VMGFGTQLAYKTQIDKSVSWRFASVLTQNFIKMSEKIPQITQILRVYFVYLVCSVCPVCFVF